MIRARIVAACGVALSLAFGVDLSAQAAAAEFSAEMVQTGPQGEISRGKRYVAKDRTRMEMTQHGQQMVHIQDAARKVEWLLYPDQPPYMERKGTPGAPSGQVMQQTGADSNPCAGMQGVTCSKLGSETMGGRKAVKWEMTFSYQGQSMKSTQWIDEERGVPLRQEMPNGQVTELKFVGMDSIDGRSVEKWEMITSRPNQESTRSYQWYDPQLQLAIRQEFPGGYVSELKNIRVGTQPDSLFAVPAGYERIQQPETGAGQPPPQMPRVR